MSLPNSPLLTNIGAIRGINIHVKKYPNIEKLYNNGNSIHSKQCCQLMVLSLAGLSSGEISTLISKQLRFSRIKNMVDKYPLLSKVVLSKKFQDMKPGLEQEISALVLISGVAFALGRMYIDL